MTPTLTARTPGIPGIAVAEGSGLFTALLLRMVARVPGRYLTFALSMTAMVSHVAGDAAYVTLIPLGALIFRAAGSSPVLGCIVVHVSISAQRAGPDHSNMRMVASSRRRLVDESRMEWMRRRSVSGASSPAAVARMM